MRAGQVQASDHGNRGRWPGAAYPRVVGFRLKLGMFGGGINIVPTSNPSDGKLELLTVDPVPKHQAIRVLARVLATRRVDDPIVHVETVSRVKILDSAGLIAMGDGDQVARGSVEISVQPGVFRVFA